MLILESVTDKPIFEASETALPEAVLCRVTYPICHIDEMNANKRVYGRDVWEGVFKDESVQGMIDQRRLFGHAEHPTEMNSDLGLTSHVVHKMWIDEAANTVMQTVDVLDTPTGRIVDCLLRAGCQAGVSTRAEGDLEEAEEDGKKFSRVVAESYRYITTDFTADPSTFGALPSDQRRGVVGAIQSEMKNEKAEEKERVFARSLLEGMSCEKSKADCECCGRCKALEDKEVDEECSAGVDVATKDKKKDKEAKIPEAKVVEMAVVGAVYVDKETGTTVKVVHIGFNDNTGEAILTVEDEMEDGYDFTGRQFIEKYEISGKLESKEDLEKPVEPASALVKEITDLKIKEASTRAEQETAVEAYDKISEKVKALDERVATDGHRLKMLITKISNEAKKHAKAVGKVVSERTITNKEVEALRTKLEEKAKTALEAEELVESLQEGAVKDLADLKESVTEREAEVASLSEKHIVEIDEGKKRHIEEGRIAGTSVVVGEYVTCKLAVLGMKIGENTRALLDECKSLREVDDILEKFTELVRRGALHSEAVESLNIDSPVDSKQSKIVDDVKSIMDNM